MVKKVMNVIKIMSIVLLTLILPLEAEIKSLVDDIFVKGAKYDLDQVQAIIDDKSLPPHHRYILAIQMAASVDNSENFDRSVELADEYSQIGTVDWALKYTQIQKAFALDLLGNRKESAFLMEEILRQNAPYNMDGGVDSLWENLSSAIPNLSNKIHDLMRQSLGSYYMTSFPEDDKTAKLKAFSHINKIRLPGLKEKNIKQFETQTGLLSEDFETKLLQSPKNNENRQATANSQIKPRQEKLAQQRGRKKQMIHIEKQKETIKITNKFPFVVSGVLLLGILILLLKIFKGKVNSKF